MTIIDALLLFGFLRSCLLTSSMDRTHISVAPSIVVKSPVSWNFNESEAEGS